jgi:hypothetical protein
MIASDCTAIGSGACVGVAMMMLILGLTGSEQALKTAIEGDPVIWALAVFVVGMCGWHWLRGIGRDESR